MNEIRLLVIEDETSTVELMKEALKDAKHNFDLKVMPDGEAALKYMRSGSILPQLILLDLNLPGMSGLEVLRVLKKSRSLRMIPVVVLTNSKSPEDVIQAYANHANAYVRKPMGFDELIQAIEVTGKFWFEVATVPDVEEEGVYPSINPPKK